MKRAKIAKLESGAGSCALVPRHCVQWTQESVRVAGPVHATAPEPRVDLVRDGDAVQAIVITCTCGQQIRLRCIYDRAGEN